jgi:prepilin-type N-terminal cleavage/methylation domain-containing protein
MLTRLHNNRGLTFIELMVAMVIMAVTSAALYLMFDQGDIILSELEHERIVFELAKKRLSVFKLLSDKDALQEMTESGSELIKHTFAEYDEDETEYLLTAEYTTTVELENTQYYRVTVDYTWIERSGADKRITLVDCYPLHPEEEE